MDGVEHQTQGPKCLRPMLYAKTEQDCPSLADLRVDDGALACDCAFAFQPSAEEDILARIPRHDVR